MNANKVMSVLKKSGRLMIVEHDEKLWATDSYWIVRLGEDSPLRPVLADYNLPVEPMVCDVWRTIRRTEADPPTKVARLFPKPADCTPVDRVLHAGKYPVSISTIGPTKQAELYQGSGDTHYALNATYVDFVEGCVKVAGLCADPTKPHGPVAALDPDGAICALVMPIRID